MDVVRSLIVAVVLVLFAGPAFAAFLQTGLPPSFDVDFRDTPTDAEIADENEAFDFGPVTATADGPDGFFGHLTNNDPLTQTAAGIGVGGPGVAGRADEIDQGLGPSEAIRLTFEVPFLLTQVGITNAGVDVIDVGFFVVENPTGIDVDPLGSFVSDASNTTAAGETTLAFAGLGRRFESGDRLIFTARAGDSYSIAGLTGRVVPLPAAGWLFVAGIAGIAAYLRRTRGRPAA